MNVLVNVNSDFFGWFDLEDALMKLGYDGELRFFYRVLRKDLKNELIWVTDDNGIKLLVDNYRKGEEAHVYIEHLVDELVGLIENVNAEKATSEAVPTVKQIDQTACDACPSGKEG